MSNPESGRRRFLSFLTSLLMGFLALLVAGPAVAYFWAPLRRKASGQGDFYDVGPITDLAIGEWRLLSIDLVQADGWKTTRVRHSIWVRRESESATTIQVLSSICPHLGCPINWNPEQSQFICPCHGGIFDAKGERTAGPPPRAMDPLEYEVRAGRLWVRWQDFKIGVTERVPVSV
ncbi:MAG TPA: ubiquinol-cytochrome c reductase iron-sulfur subunit [Gemmataceae bacterium]|nr:ubiquinol-cytochrome c reductase iron-sulfur subunit [Gemmataceae bacterium]